jgi:hypothetical protein
MKAGLDTQSHNIYIYIYIYIKSYIDLENYNEHVIDLKIKEKNAFI